MAFLSLSWLEGGIIFLLGAIVGALIYALIAKKYLTAPVEDNKPSIENELIAYENAVHHHLLHTAELLQQLGTDYEHLIEHARHGMHELGKPTYQGHNVFPHFPQPHTVSSKKENASPVMPKTYVDPDRQDKE